MRYRFKPEFCRLNFLCSQTISPIDNSHIQTINTQKALETLIHLSVISSERGHAEFDKPQLQNIGSTKLKVHRTDTKILTTKYPIEHHGDERISRVITHG